MPWPKESPEQRRGVEKYKARRDELAEKTAQEVFLWETRDQQTYGSSRRLNFDRVTKQFGLHVAKHLQMFREGSKKVQGLVFFANRHESYADFRHACLAEVARLLLLDSYEWDGGTEAEPMVTLSTVREDFGDTAAGIWAAHRNNPNQAKQTRLESVHEFLERLAPSADAGKDKKQHQHQHATTTKNKKKASSTLTTSDSRTPTRASEHSRARARDWRQKQATQAKTSKPNTRTAPALAIRGGRGQAQVKENQATGGLDLLSVLRQLTHNQKDGDKNKTTTTTGNA